MRSSVTRFAPSASTEVVVSDKGLNLTIFVVCRIEELKPNACCFSPEESEAFYFGGSCRRFVPHNCQGNPSQSAGAAEYRWEFSAIRPLRCNRLDQFQAFDYEAAQRKGRTRRFLDLFVHQLLARHTLCPRVGGKIQGQRSGGDRGSHAGVWLRAAITQCREGCAKVRNHVP